MIYAIEYEKDDFWQQNTSRSFFCILLIIYKIHALIIFMRFEKIPYYLRQSVDEIVADARKKSPYITQKIELWRAQARATATWCQIIDHNNYSEYFYELNKFEILEPKVIKCMDQRSAHQNGILALKKMGNWSSRISLTPDSKKWKNQLKHRKNIDRKSHPTSTIQIQEVNF